MSGELRCPHCDGIVKPSIGHNAICFFICHGCGSVTSFGNLIDGDEVLTADKAIAMYKTRPEKPDAN